MSPVFRHGRLRLYLLKLLDEAPRHGYEVISLLRDRFLGVYSPSPGTIYPRLARLEEEGLVTRDEAGGRKVYRITEKGRQELRDRIGDLLELEEELAASARGIAMEIGRDVRDTVRSLREELGRAAANPAARTRSDAAADSDPNSGPDPDSGSRPAAGPGSRPIQGAGWASGSGAGWTRGPARLASSSSRADLDQLATDFAGDIQSAARARSGLDEAGLRELRGILADALTRIRTEVFGPADQNAASEPAPEDHPPTP